MRFWFFVFLAFLFSAFSARASVIISEIMYDVEGADIGREWVEIQNIGPQVDLTGWKFFEANVNHGLTLIQGNISLQQNGFAIIADNAEKFLLDWPEFSGTLFDSSFSLSNSGETLILRDAGLADMDSVAYSSDSDANGDGKSLQKINGEWISALPTLGKDSIGSSGSPSPYQGGGTMGGGNNGAEIEKISASIPEPKPSPFQAFAGRDRSALAGAEMYFEGGAEGISEDMVSKARFLWNFGDGTIGEGKNIKHIFQYPGNYIINLDVSFGAYSASDSAKINVSPAGIEISEIKPSAYIEIKNESSKISDVSGFAIQINDSKIFNFPKDSMLSPNSFLALDSNVLGLEIPDTGEIKILYPNGKVLFSSKYESNIFGEKESFNFDGERWAKGESTPGTKNSIKKELTRRKVITPPPPLAGVIPPLTVRVGEEKEIQSLSRGGVTGIRENAEASVVNSQKSSSFWSEIKWLIFGLGAGVLIGTIYLFIKHRLLKNQATI